MIELPIWTVVVLVGLLPLVGLSSYTYGWKLHAQFGERVIHVTRVERRNCGAPITPKQREAFDEAFSHMDRAFESMGKVFERE